MTPSPPRPALAGLPLLATRLDPHAARVALALAPGLSRVARTRSPRPALVRPGGMGDLVLLTAAARARGLDAHDLDWVIERRALPWARHLGLAALCWDTGSGARALAGRRHVTVLCTEQHYGLALATSRALRDRGGRLVAFDTVAGSARADVVVRYDPLDRHESLSFGDLLQAAGLGASRPADAPWGRVHAAQRPAVLAIAGTGAYGRDLDEQAWHAVIDALLPSGEFAVSAAPADTALARRLVARTGGRARLLQGFEESVQHVARSERLVTLDGGMVHVASYYGVPTDVLFTAGRDRKWAPLAPGSRSWLRADLACRPCTLFGRTPPCPFDLECTDVTTLLAQPPVRG